MTPVIVLAIIVLVPVVVLMVLRVNAALVFLSLCLGVVLGQFVAGDAYSLLSLFGSRPAAAVTANSALTPSHNLATIVLLLLPVLLTTIFMIHTVKGARLILNILPAAGVGLLGALLVVPLLSAGLSANIVASPLWTQASRAQDLIVGASALVCLFVLWMQRPKTAGDGKHGKHHG
ncbi:MAG: hypothetical protein ABI602_00825 [Candidatus Saccharibacteria bacterium]